jgi:hypothetical protein
MTGPARSLTGLTSEDSEQRAAAVSAIAARLAAAGPRTRRRLADRRVGYDDVLAAGPDLFATEDARLVYSTPEHAVAGDDGAPAEGPGWAAYARWGALMAAAAGAGFAMVLWAQTQQLGMAPPKEAAATPAPVVAPATQEASPPVVAPAPPVSTQPVPARDVAAHPVAAHVERAKAAPVRRAARAPVVHTAAAANRVARPLPRTPVAAPVRHELPRWVTEAAVPPPPPRVLIMSPPPQFLAPPASTPRLMSPPPGVLALPAG